MFFCVCVCIIFCLGWRWCVCGVCVCVCVCLCVLCCRYPHVAILQAELDYCGVVLRVAGEAERAVVAAAEAKIAALLEHANKMATRLQQRGRIALAKKTVGS